MHWDQSYFITRARKPTMWQNFQHSVVGLLLLALWTAAEDVASLGSQDNDVKGLNKLLAWSIENSNLTDLKDQALATDQHEAASLSAKRIAELREVMAQLNSEPSDAELMKEALGIVGNASISQEQRLQALTALRYLVEPIDNAKDFPGLGGITSLTKVISSPVDRGLHSEALHILGTAASNNPDVQNAALSVPKLVPAICKGLESDDVDVVKKGLYALATLIRNSHSGQERFYGSGGVQLLHKHLLNPGSTVILRRVLDLIHDLADAEGHVQGSQELAQEEMVRHIVELVKHPDFDVRERSVLSLIALSGRTGGRRVLASPQSRQALKAARELAMHQASSDPVLRPDVIGNDAGGLEIDEDYREILEQFAVLVSDLEDRLDHFRDEL